MDPTNEFCRWWRGWGADHVLSDLAIARLVAWARAYPDRVEEYLTLHGFAVRGLDDGRLARLAYRILIGG